MGAVRLRLGPAAMGVASLSRARLRLGSDRGRS